MSGDGDSGRVWCVSGDGDIEKVWCVNSDVGERVYGKVMKVRAASVMCKW